MGNFWHTIILFIIRLLVGVILCPNNFGKPGLFEIFKNKKPSTILWRVVKVIEISDYFFSAGAGVACTGTVEGVVAAGGASTFPFR